MTEADFSSEVGDYTLPTGAERRGTETPDPALAAGELAVQPVASEQITAETPWTESQRERAILLATNPTVAAVAYKTAYDLKHPDADALYSDTIIKIARDSRIDLSHPGFLSYVKRIVHHLCVDDYRHTHRTADPPTVSMDTSELDALIEKGSIRRLAYRSRDIMAQSPERIVMRKLLLEQLINNLSPTHRELIVLVYGEGYEVKEAAKRLDIPEGTAKSRVWYALRHMRINAEAQGLTLGEILHP